MKFNRVDLPPPPAIHASLLPLTMRTLQTRSHFIIAAVAAAFALTQVTRADDTSATAFPQTTPPPTGTAPVLTTPTRSTPLSASQTSATPVNGTETDTSQPGFTGWTKPAWLSDLSFGFKESFDDNILRVSGNGLPRESSWVDVFSLKIGFNLSSWVAADPGTIQTFSVIYQPDKVVYNQASSESFTAHRVNTILKGKSGDLTFSFDDAWTRESGNTVPPMSHNLCSRRVKTSCRLAANRSIVGSIPGHQRRWRKNW